MDEYGAYMELVYLHTKDNMLLDMDIVFKMNAIQFLFVSQYLIRKSKIEYNEQKAMMNKNKVSY